MALTAKKYEALYVTTGTGDDKVKDEDLTKAEAIFDHYRSKGMDDYFRDLDFAPIMFLIQQMQDELDYLRTEISNNKDKTGISTAQANAITANTAKTGMTIGTGANQAMAGNTTIPPVTVTLAAGLSLILEPNIDTRNRIYELGIGVIDSSGKTPVKYTGKVTLT